MCRVETKMGSAALYFQADHGVLTMGIVIPRTTAGFLWTPAAAFPYSDLPLCI